MSKTVAVIGASSNRTKFGNKALRAFERQGYTVIPINLYETAVEGHTGLRIGARCAGGDRHGDGLRAAGGRCRSHGELARKGVAEVWLNPGADGAEVVARARELGLNIIQACSIIAIGESPVEILTTRARSRRRRRARNISTTEERRSRSPAVSR